MNDPRQTATSPPPPGRRRVLRIVLAAAALGLAAFAAFCIVIDHYGQVDRAQSAQAIVVLGCRVEEGGVPGDSLRARTLRAVRLYQDGYAPAMICTGGVGTHPPAESLVSAELAQEEGVPAPMIFREEQSTNTYENARYAAEICREQGWTRVLVVSDPYHLYRARRNFEHFGLTVATSPASECRRNRELPLRVVYTVREGLALIRDMMHGH